MRRRIFTILFLIACWTSYTDLTSGSLPGGQQVRENAGSTRQTAIPYKNIMVTPGDTLLSVIERVNQSVPDISQVMQDFTRLNPSVDPNHLQIGRTYAFPVYDQKH
ncbi:LysM domain-containing protein [Sporolactobacillus sp. Y61]|uniref:LysM domain-containing protein n=1 Tax=Sporolactobacillus sp. Y61 TaxID=3160863 RepID=A0AAU8IEQ0_9BACL|nr:LysM domain-containing protein [Sporolactobacillus sp. THM19-2]RYL90422.1 LysM peptidoglycan-binding domain-containing protein [Sporolactobacillus sp. THM19-2]